MRFAAFIVLFAGSFHWRPLVPIYAQTGASQPAIAGQAPATTPKKIPYDALQYRDRGLEKPADGKTVPANVDSASAGISTESIISKTIYPFDAREIVEEGTFRRREVVFLLAFPFAALASFGLLQAVNVTVYDNPVRQPALSHLIFTGVSASAMAGFLAYHDELAWRDFKAKTLRELNFRGPGESAPELPAIGSAPRAWRFEMTLGRAQF